MKNPVEIISPDYNAAELKWIISQMSVFGGARTHATIAALSSGVPTVSFAYSIKALGINQDVYGHRDYCIEPKAFTSKKVVDTLSSVIESQDQIRESLTHGKDYMHNAAMSAGDVLRRTIQQFNG